MEKSQPRRRTRIGTVTSNAMDKTVVVRVDRIVKHPMYRKYLSRHNKFKAHDPSNDCRVGDRVLIRECRPLSKTKHWVVVEILTKASI